MWVKAAEGTSLEDLKTLIADRELKKGTRVKWVIDPKIPGAANVFNMVGAELAFKPFIPDGMELVDVYEEGGQGIVEMEADPAWLVAVVAFAKAHWLAITIATVALVAIIKLITMWVDIVGRAASWLLVIVLFAAVGMIVYGIWRSRGPP